jgi:cell division transport system permease protein
MRAFEYTKKNIRRTPYQALAASMVMFLTFLTLILFMIIAFGSERILHFYENKPQVLAFFKDNTTETDVKAIQDALIQTGRVTNLKFVSKEEALEIYKEKNKDQPLLLELVTANVLPTSLEISTLSPNDLAMVAQVLEKEPVIEDVIYPKDVVQTLTNSISVIRFVGVAAVGFLVTFALLVIVMIIGFKIRLKRNEIETMKLLGGSVWFIRAPFILEGMFYGLMGAVLAWALTYALIWYFTPQLKFYLQGIPQSVIQIPVPPLFMLGLLGAAILISITIGAIGSFGALKRYLRL